MTTGRPAGKNFGLPSGSYSQGMRRWVANYGATPGSLGDLHQYTETGRVAGYDGDVDLSCSMTCTVDEFVRADRRQLRTRPLSGGAEVARPGPR